LFQLLLQATQAFRNLFTLISRVKKAFQLKTTVPKVFQGCAETVLVQTHSIEMCVGVIKVPIIPSFE
jgi:hypothetical protein